MIGMAKGMVTTLKFLLRPAATVQYPKVRRTLPERSRTMFTLPLNDDGQPACKACLLCEKNCPTGAIDFNQEESTQVKDAGAIVVALGASLYDCTRLPATRLRPGAGRVYQPGIRADPLCRRPYGRTCAKARWQRAQEPGDPPLRRQPGP